MKKVILILVIIVPFIMMAQENEKEKKEKKFGVKFSGFIRNDIIYNTRKVIAARGENDFTLAPLPVELDRDGNDINSVPNYNIVSFTTRLRAKVTGPDAFGAKTSGLIEADFLGSTALSKFDLRLRHAIIKLDWKKGHLLMGQYWHPMFVTDCYPKTVSFGAGITFNPFARNPQVRYTYNFTEKFSLSGAILSQGQYRSKGDHYSQQNAAIPETNIHLQYKTDFITVGAQFDYQVLKPRIVTDSNYTTNTLVASMSYLAYVKFNLKPLTVKLYGIYGQSNDNMVMMGGYAVKDRVYTPEEIDKNFVEYLPYNTATGWLDIETTGKKVQYGLFLGYSKNMGAADSVLTDTYVGRWGNVNALMRIAPRVVFTSNKLKIGFEIEYSLADYAEQKFDANGNIDPNYDIDGIDKYGNVTNYNTADNIKFLLSAAYIF